MGYEDIQIDAFFLNWALESLFVLNLTFCQDFLVKKVHWVVKNSQIIYNIWKCKRPQNIGDKESSI